MKKSPELVQNLYPYLLWDQSRSITPEERLQSAAARICRQHPLTRHTDCHTAFYPYVGLKSTIQVKERWTRIRISDILRNAPQEVFEALVHILISRAAGSRPDRRQLLIYNEYAGRPEIEAGHARTRRVRVHKQLLGPVGRYYNLHSSFQRINRRYFNNSLTAPTLSWSPRSSRMQLGYHDAHLNLIVVSRWLDRKTVPEMIVDYIMYHEILHIVVQPESRNGKRIVHSRKFKELEQQYEFYEEAIRWIKQK